ncbi:hypothetical protein ALC57_16686, partial [Trachymyrmex cornetzi]
VTDGKETCGENGGRGREREGNTGGGEEGAWRTGRSLRSSAGSSAATGRGDLDVGVATRGGGALRKSPVDSRTITAPRRDVTTLSSLPFRCESLYALQEPLTRKAFALSNRMR